MDIKTLKEYCQMAASTAKDAVAAMLKDISRSKQVKLDKNRDVKIFADNKIESFIIDRLLKYSRYSILSEESGIIGQRKINDNVIGYRWIVDPLDGTLNFLKGIPICCVSIALWHGPNPLLGVVYDFNRNELFKGIVGGGAWLNNRAIKVGVVSQRSKAIICTGFPVGTNFSTDSIMKFVKTVQIYKKVRIIGSAALSLAYVSCGRVDCYWENDIQIWDVAAGLSLVKAAGGSINFERSTLNNTMNAAAANKLLIKDL